MATKAFDDSTYEHKIQQLSEHFLAQTQGEQSIALQKKTSNLFRHRQSKNNRLDVRHFNHVIEVDEKNLVAQVEGMTTYADLVKATLAKRCLPAVVPELKTITVGGALSGVGIESSSFRYGLVHETIEEFDALVGDGRIVTARPDNDHRDLFYSFANSYGTLGYALKLNIKLIKALSYVKLTRLRFDNASAFFENLQQLCEENSPQGKINFIEGVIFSGNEMVITLGEFVEQAPYTSNYKYMNIYYRSIQTRDEDYLSTEDYIWRWDSDWFWCSKVFGMQNRVLRFLLGKWMLNSRMYWRLMRIANHNRLLKTLLDRCSKRRESVIQDTPVTMQQASEFYEFFAREIGITPIWICPFTSPNKQVCFNLFPLDPNQWYVNFGYWDTVPSDQPVGHYNRLIEKKLMELKSFKSLYSNVYYTPEEFWKIFNKPCYDHLKKQYDPKGVLNDLYQKCVEKIV